MTSSLIVAAALGLFRGAAAIPPQHINFGNAWRFQFGTGGDDGPWGGDGFDAFEVLPQGSVCTNSDGTEIEHNPNRFNSWDCEISCLYSNMVGDDATDSNPDDKVNRAEGGGCWVLDVGGYKSSALVARKPNANSYFAMSCCVLSATFGSKRVATATTAATPT